MISMAFTMHACEADKQGFQCQGTECGDFGEDRFKGVCDKNGCDIQRIRFMGKDQTQELLALADTIKVLNDDDALELFKKTLPSGASSFLQIEVTDKAQRQAVIEVLRGSKDPRVDFFAIALRGGKADFSKILELIDELVATLKAEMTAGAEKKDWCNAEIYKTEDNKMLCEARAFPLLSCV